MSKSLFIILISIITISSSCIIVIAQSQTTNNDCTKCTETNTANPGPSEENNTWEILGISGLISLFVGFVFNRLLESHKSKLTSALNTQKSDLEGKLTKLKIDYQSKIDEISNVRRLYNEPYTKWCIQIHGAIREFSELCSEIRKEIPSDQKKIERTKNNLNVISHFWDMYREVYQGYKWLGVIERKEITKEEKKSEIILEKKTSQLINELFDVVDTLWHEFENANPFLLSKQSTEDDRKLILMLLSDNAKKKISEQIITKICGDDVFERKKLDKIKQFLLDEIPTDQQTKIHLDKSGSSD